MLKKTQIACVAMLCLSLALFINSCKKADHASEEKPTAGNVPDWIKAALKKQIGGITMQVNKKSPAVYLDADGNEVDFSARRLAKMTAIPCDAEEDDFLDNVFTFKSQTVWYVCGEDLRLTVEYELSTAFTPVLANPANPSQVSRGRFRVRDLSGTTIVSNSSVTPVTITLVGPDPVYPDKNVYKINYTVTGLDPEIMLAIVTMENRPIIYTDCADVITTPGSWEGTATGPITQACSKIDRIGVFANTFGGNQVYFHGCDDQINTTSTCYPLELVEGRPDEHEIEWRKPGDATYGDWPEDLPADWNDLTATSFTQRVSWPYVIGCSATANAAYKQELLPFYDVRGYIFPVSGLIELRYRNVKVAIGGSPCAAISCASDDWLYTTVTVIP